MCGIAGILNTGPKPGKPDLDAMMARLGHRGPDETGSAVSGPCLLGHTRGQLAQRHPV